MRTKTAEEVLSSEVARVKRDLITLRDDYATCTKLLLEAMQKINKYQRIPVVEQTFLESLLLDSACENKKDIEKAMKNIETTQNMLDSKLERLYKEQEKLALFRQMQSRNTTLDSVNSQVPSQVKVK